MVFTQRRAEEASMDLTPGRQPRVLSSFKGPPLTIGTAVLTDPGREASTKTCFARRLVRHSAYRMAPHSRLLLAPASRP